MHFDRVKCYTKSYHRHRMNPTCASNKLQSIIKLGVVTSIWRNLHMNWPKLDWNLHVVILCQPNIFNEHCMWCQRAYVTVAGLQAYKVRISVHIDYISQFITLWKYNAYHMCVILRSCDLTSKQKKINSSVHKFWANGNAAQRVKCRSSVKDTGSDNNSKISRACKQ